MDANKTVRAAFERQVTVSSAVDNNTAGTLRYALTNAQDYDVIDVAPSVTSITLGSALPAISKRVTINGNGLTIGGNNAYRILLVNSTGIVSINRVHFTNGNSGNANGGAIYSSGSALMLHSCIFRNNKTSATYYGGAIFNIGTLAVSGCTFYGNTANTGGAIYHYGSIATLTGNIFFGNTATYGNAVYQSSGTVTSGGYNVSDMATGTSATTGSGFTFATGDVQTSSLPVSTVSFRVVEGSVADGRLPATLPAGYPSVDFYGAAIAAGGAAGAVQQVLTGYLLDVAALGSGTVAPSPTPDADGMYAANATVTLTATPGDAAVTLSYWTVDGLRVEPAGSTLQVVMNGNKAVRAVFERHVTVSSAADNNTAGTLRYALTNAQDYDAIDVAPSVTSITLGSALPIIT
jgi:hypothetical protein